MTRFVPMEGLVRPFQTVGVSPLSVNLSAPLPPGIVECKLGGSGGRTTTFTLEGGGAVISKNTEDFKESDRKSTLVRAENEDDPSQFVEFCRADKVTLSPKKNRQNPPKASSYDTTGGMNPGARGKRNYEFQYPEDKTCKPKNPPKGGNC